MDLPEGGKLRWEGLASAEKGDPAVEANYLTTQLAENFYLLSWLEGIGYTVSLMIDVNTKEVTGIASNNEEHYPLKGSLLELTTGSEQTMRKHFGAPAFMLTHTKRNRNTHETALKTRNRPHRNCCAASLRVLRA